MNRRSFSAALLAIGAFASLVPSVSSAPDENVQRIYTDVRSPVGMAFDDDGALFVAEWSAGRITRFAPDGTRSVFADEKHLKGRRARLGNDISSTPTGGHLCRPFTCQAPFAKQGRMRR